MKEHFLDDLPKIKNVSILTKKLDDYEATRYNIKTMSKNSYTVEDRKPKIHLREHPNTKLFFRHQILKNRQSVNNLINKNESHELNKETSHQ